MAKVKHFLDYAVIDRLRTGCEIEQSADSFQKCIVRSYENNCSLSIVWQKSMARPGDLQSSLLYRSRSEELTTNRTDQRQFQTGKPLRRLKKNLEKNINRNWSELRIAVGRNTVLRLTASQTGPGCVECCTMAPPDRKDR